MKVDVRLNAIVDPERANGRPLAELARMVVAGGATLIQLRDKHGSTRRMIEEARAIKAALAGSGVPLVINDRVDVALVAQADGVHVGPDDMRAEDARRLLGPNAIIGVSIKTVAMANAAPLDVIDYAGIGGVYATTSKDNPDPPIGVEGLRVIVAAFCAVSADIPVCGIAGIDATNAAHVIEGGADGVAAISALSMRPDPRAAARAIAGYRRQGVGAAMTAIAATIAGSDSGGGAGIQADLKTFSALNVYGASILTAITAQNTKGVTAIHDVPPDIITAQIDAIFSDLAVNAVKIGMLSTPAAIMAVAAGLDRHRAQNIVLDPVMIATSGDRLLAPEAVDILKRELIPRALVVTPNLLEAAALLDAPLAGSESAMRQQAEKLLALGARAVLLKGGHASGAQAVDLLVTPTATLRLTAPRNDTRNTHGTGCTLSSAIAAGLAKGLPLVEAATDAKAYVTAAIEAADELTIGQGRGPVHHFHAWW